MRKVTIKILLIALLASWSHQTMQRHCTSHNDCTASSPASHLHDCGDVLSANKHHHGECFNCRPCEHCHETHRLFSEFTQDRDNTDRLKQIRFLTVAFFHLHYFDSQTNLSACFTAKELGTKDNSLIPQYLRAQSFLI